MKSKPNLITERVGDIIADNLDIYFIAMKISDEYHNITELAKQLEIGLSDIIRGFDINIGLIEWDIIAVEYAEMSELLRNKGV